ncbi:MAG: hypothetical protein JWP29_4034 [Rhodoferax sp.]|nr:hypothetical protein [Rhodoferax sp.]
MQSKPVRFLVLIEAGDGMIARFFDANHVHMSDIDASSEEVAVMTRGLTPEHLGNQATWLQALSSHNPEERAAAQIYTLEL